MYVVLDVTGLARSFCLIHLKVTSTIALTPKPLRQLHSSPCTTASSSSQETRACTGHGSSIPTADEATRMAFPLCGEPPRQFLTSDGETIVCVHPSSPADFSNTKVSCHLGHMSQPLWSIRAKVVESCTISCAGVDPGFSEGGGG